MTQHTEWRARIADAKVQELIDAHATAWWNYARCDNATDAETETREIEATAAEEALQEYIASVRVKLDERTEQLDAARASNVVAVVIAILFSAALGALATSIFWEKAMCQ